MEIIKLDNICDVKTGNKNKENNDENGLFPFYTRSQIILKSNNYTIDEEAIIIPGEGSFIPMWNMGKAAIHQRTYIIKSSNLNKLLNKYLYYWWFKNYKILKQSAVGSTVKSLRKFHFLKPQINLPNLKYQQDIISIIEPFENLELLYQEKKNNLVNLLTSLYKHNSSSKKIKLLSFSKIMNSKWKNQKYYVETKNINDNYEINGSLKKINIDTKPSRANLSVEKNSIIFSKLKGSIKLFPIFDEKYSKFVYSTGFFNIFSLLSNSYLFGFLNSDEFLEQKNANSTGTLMQGLNKKSLDNIYLYQPNKIYKLDIILILISKINILIKLINDIINNLINLFIL